jgi:hypothetical protein
MKSYLLRIIHMSQEDKSAVFRVNIPHFVILDSIFNMAAFHFIQLFLLTLQRQLQLETSKFKIIICFTSELYPFTLRILQNKLSP